MTRSPRNEIAAYRRANPNRGAVPPEYARIEDRGAAAVEFAIVMPLLLLLVCGIVDFGRMLNVQISLSGAAREGARWAALRLDTTTSTSVPSRVNQAAPDITSPGPVTQVVSSCPASPQPTDHARVRANYTYTMLTPLSAVAGLFGGAVSGTITLTGWGDMRCGG